MLNNDFTFGIEIEFIGATLYAVEAVMHSRGVNCYRENYNHVTRTNWKLVSDASVSGTGGGELVSPILRGEDGLIQLKEVLTALNSIPGITVNSTCGLHVHLAWRGMTADHVKTVCRRYAEFEGEIDSFMPRSRRGTSNRWCGSTIDTGHGGGFRLANVLEHNGDMFGLPARSGGRYFKVNLHSISRYGTVEFRHHSGTTDYDKISNWVRFLIAFVEKSTTLSGNTSNIRVSSSSRAYAAIRARVEAAGGKMAFRGGQNWNVTGQDGTVVYSITELNLLYAGSNSDKRWQDWSAQDWTLNSDRFNDFFNRHFPAQTTENDKLFSGVDADVAAFYAERAVDLA